MDRETNEIFEFGPFHLDVVDARLSRDGAPVSLPPKVFDLLVYLVARAGRLVEKEELLRALWPDSFVEEANLTVNVATLRRALGTREDGQNWIETVPKRGYRFSPDVKRISAEPPPASAAEPAKTSPRKFLIPVSVAIALAAVLYLAVSNGWVPGKRARRGNSPSLAVLPFAAIGGDSAAGLGMTDALINRLGTIPSVSVRSLSTVRRFQENPTDPVEAGRALGVETVVTGSVQQLDKRIRVSVMLQRVEDGQSLWADKFDEFQTNLFAVQDTISEKIAGVLALRLTSEEQERMLRRFTESTEAYRLYSLGRFSRLRNQLEAIEYYQRSLTADSRYALPYVELADLYAGMAGNGIAEFRKFGPLAREAAIKALQLAPDMAEAHVAASSYRRVVDRDFPGARKELEIAMQLNPRSAQVRQARASLLAIEGDVPAGISEARIAMELDPFDGRIADDLAWLLHCNGQDEEALAWLDQFARRDHRPQLPWGRFYALMGLRRFPEAIASFENYRKSVSPVRAVNGQLACAYALSGDLKQARELVASLPPDWGFYQRAIVDLAAGDRDAAFANLNRAVEERNVFIEWIKADPSLKPLHGDPRFAAVVQRLGLIP